VDLNGVAIDDGCPTHYVGLARRMGGKTRDKQEHKNGKSHRPRIARLSARANP
jgi:hypothetical protein